MTFVPWRADDEWYRKAYPHIGWTVEENGCHTFTGQRDDKGYGVARYQKRTYRAHHIRYLLEVGPIPDGMVLDHFACDGGPRGCCNPLHCRPVTRRENALRGDTLAASCAAKTHCHRGHEFTADNTLITRVGKRVCRTCKRQRRYELYHTNETFRRNFIAKTNANARRRREAAHA